MQEYTAGDFIEDWDVEGLLRRVQEIFIPSVDLGELDPHQIDREELTQHLQDEASELYDQREEQLGEELMRALERFLLLQTIDQRWREHLYDMDYLREGIHLRGFAQIEPLVAYKNEAFELFRDLMNSIWGDFAQMIFHVEVTVDPGQAGPPAPPSRRPSSRSSSTGGNRNVTYSGGGAQSGAMAMAAAAGGAGVEELRRRGAAARRRAAPRRRDRPDRAQRPVLVRLGQEVQEMSWRMSAVTSVERGRRPSG